MQRTFGQQLVVIVELFERERTLYLSGKINGRHLGLNKTEEEERQTSREDESVTIAAISGRCGSPNVLPRLLGFQASE
ncbi:MAG: hypothetical protein ACR2L2_09505 [Acidobacteriota bacterium]